MELQMQSANGGKAQKVTVSDEAFGRDFNESLVHQVVTAYMAKGRRGTKAQKTRAKVSGGGRKPWRQKGTGQARAGTIRSPLWRGGGKIFAAEPRDHSRKVNRKMYRGAMQAIVSELARQDRLVLVDEFSIAAPRTKLMAELLKDLGVGDALLVIEAFDEKVYLASRNLKGVDMLEADAVDPVSLVGSEKVVMTVGALRKIEEKLA